MAKIFSAEQIRLNGNLLSGNSNGTIYYNGSQLTQGSSAVPQTFDIVAGDGLSGGGVILVGEDVEVSVILFGLSAGG